VSGATSGQDPLHATSEWVTMIAPQIEAQVHVSSAARATGAETKVSVDHLLADELEGALGWRISTRPTFLPSAHFGSMARHCVKTASHARGRALYCHERQSGEVIAAASYHLDERSHWPLMVTTLAFRIDAGEDAGLAAASLAGVLILKHHLHAIAAKVGRGGHVDIDLAEAAQEPLLRRLGFRPAPRVEGLRPGNLHLRQDAPAQSSATGG
jgi:hypothetical protein